MTEQPIDRRGFLRSAGAIGAAAFASPALSAPKTSSTAVSFRAAELIAGSGVSHAYAVKAGPFVFLNGHEGYDFERGWTPEVLGPAAYPGYGRPPLRREADHMVGRMGALLQQLGAGPQSAVRVDQYYTSPDAVRAYHLARLDTFGRSVPPSTSIIMDRCFTTHSHMQASLVAIVPADGWRPERFNPPELPVSSASGYAQAVRVNDFVFVAGNMASANVGSGLEPTLRAPPGSGWGRAMPVRGQTEWIITRRLEPALRAAGASLAGALKAQVHVADVADIPDFLDVWATHFRDIPCALTVIPAKGFGYAEGIVEINLIALKDGASRRKQVLQTDIPPMAAYGPAIRAGELVFPSGLMAIGRDGRVVGGEAAAAFDGLGLPARLQAQTVLAYAESVCKAAGTSMRNAVRAQYFLTDIADFAGVSGAWVDRYGRQPHPFAAVQIPGPLPAREASLIADFWIYAG